MDVDLASVEIVFAQKLACGEPGTRMRALKVLHQWILDQSATKPFEEADLMRLCKGLHYVMWMQDKMLLQEELADRIGGLLNIFRTDEEKILYVKCFLKSLSKEWPHIDRWRMDKFLMEVRRLLRTTFAHLAGLGWKKEIREKYWDAFKSTVISSDASFSDSLKFHFTSLYLDELDLAGGLNKKQVQWCLEPYAELLGDRTISDYLFDSVSDEIFSTILHQISEEFASKAAGEEIQQGGIEFNYKAIGKMLFDVGKRESVTCKRRSKIYKLVKKFEVAATGKDPLHFEVPVPAVQLRRADYEKAAEDILELERQMREETRIAKKKKSSKPGAVPQKKSEKVIKKVKKAKTTPKKSSRLAKRRT